MAKAVIDIKNKDHLASIKRIMVVNGIDNSNHDKVMNKALEIAYQTVTTLPEMELQVLTNLNKSL